ncbi:MAG: FAD-dependent thymidylate synthase [Proteobacteria bacterium]|nr:FAD-dependent thymidylate synthase [Pseudomonadota bacterium]NBP12946.1 FAD-dependent thymidylate synthase [bacterium]
MNVKLISLTQPVIEGILSPEDLISYIARVSNPSNQMNTETAPRLLAYLIKHKHWSPFEQVSLTFQIVTSRAIAAQILRHRSFCFQEFSQRYSEVTDFESFQVRKQADKNRQSSADLMDLSEEDLANLKEYLVNGAALYDDLIKKGAAKECARMILPLCTQTTMYMTGNLRSWIHYVDLRSNEDTQLEHREIAIAIKDALISIFPNTSEALNWKK